MTNLGDYTSLLQLGFGIGVGLSLFRAPMELLSKKFEADLSAEFSVITNGQTTRALEKRARLSELQLKFTQTSITLNRFHLPFMIASILGAGVNWYYLARASSHAADPLTKAAECWLTFVSGPLFLLLFVIVTALSFFTLRPLRRELDNERS